MKNILLNLLAALFTKLDADTVRKMIDSALDKLEDTVAESDTTVDDTLVLPIVKLIRLVTGTPDDFDGDED